MKTYIFLTSNIHPIGGMELYVAGKALYLESLGYEVKVFSASSDKGNCAIASLNKHIRYDMCELALPPYKWPRIARHAILRRMRHLVGECSGEVIVESNTDSYSQWGELLAAQLHAKHVCFLCNELFRGKYKYYQENLDFYYYKYQRHELYGIGEDSLCKLFEGYRFVPEKGERVFFAAPAEAVQDTDDERVNLVGGADWTIAYIGRISKQYVDNILDGVAAFAGCHPERSLQVVVVGDPGEKKADILRRFEALPYVKTIFLGDMVPIPRALFSKLDAVIAGSGSALCAAAEGVPTILANADTCLAGGLLGYDTQDFLYNSDNVEQTTFDVAIERTLIEKAYQSQEFHLPKSDKPSFYYEQHLQLVDQSAPEVEYYSEAAICAASSNAVECLKSEISFRLPWAMRLLNKG